MAKGEGNKLRASTVEERIGTDDERIGPPLANSSESRFDFAFTACSKHKYLTTLSTRRVLDVSRLGRRRRIFWVYQHADNHGPRYHLTEQGKSLSSESRDERAHSRHIAAGPVEAILLLSAVPARNSL